jgi:hypothetical protein
MQKLASDFYPYASFYGVCHYMPCSCGKSAVTKLVYNLEFYLEKEVPPKRL